MYRFLLVNRGTCNNLGDQAINSEFIKFLKDNFSCQIYTSDYTSNLRNASKIIEKQHAGKIYDVIRSAIKKLLPLNVIWFIRNYLRISSSIGSIKPDLVIIGGGQLLLPGRFSVASFLWVYLAKKHNKKVVFSNVGFGGSFSKLEYKLIKWALKNTDGINVRDKESANSIRKIFHIEVNVSADIVFTGYNPVASHKKHCAVAITALSVYNLYNRQVSRDAYYDMWVKFITDKNVALNEIILSYTTQEDYQESLMFHEYAKKNYGYDISLMVNNDLSSYLENMKSTKMLFSGRMHGLLLALNSGADIHVFPISKKLISFSSIVSGNDIKDLKMFTAQQTKRFLSSYIKSEELISKD